MTFSCGNFPLQISERTAERERKPKQSTSGHGLIAMTVAGLKILPYRKGGLVRSTESRQAMMPCDRWQFEYSQVSGGERIRTHHDVKNKDCKPFHNSRFHVEEP